jgi:hypothetical protein
MSLGLEKGSILNMTAGNVNHVASQSQTLDSSSTKESIEDQDITSAVDTLFMEADIHTFTVKDIVSSVQDLFQTNLNKVKRKLIKKRLIELVNQVQEEQEQEEQLEQEQQDEDQVQDDSDCDSDSDASESSNPPPKTKTRKGKSAKK